MPVVRFVKTFLFLVAATAVVILFMNFVFFSREVVLENLYLVLVYYVLAAGVFTYFRGWVDKKEKEEKKDMYAWKNEAFSLGILLGVVSGGHHILNTQQASFFLMGGNVAFYGLIGYLFGKAMKGKVPPKDDKKDRKNSKKKKSSKRK